MLSEYMHGLKVNYTINHQPRLYLTGLKIVYAGVNRVKCLENKTEFTSIILFIVYTLHAYLTS